MKISLSTIHKQLGKLMVVSGVNLTIEPGEMLFLLGPSGCGKTTLLRLLAGFLIPDQGEILFDDRVMNQVPAHRRNTALVFQNYALWPHLSVFENVAYGLRLRKVPKPLLKKRVEKALSQIQMLDFANRKITQLSGGQQQRVALARAFVVEPDLLMFDEPLSNLDARLRLEMRQEIKRLHLQNGITSLFVTHDQDEALSMATRIAVMNQGVIQQIGTPQEIYREPVNKFVAGFIGEMNFIHSGCEWISALGGNPDYEVGFRPEHVQVDTHGGGCEATVTDSTYLGVKNEILLRTGDGIEIKAWTPEPIPTGVKVFFRVARHHLHHFASEPRLIPLPTPTQPTPESTEPLESNPSVPEAVDEAAPALTTAPPPQPKLEQAFIEL